MSGGGTDPSAGVKVYHVHTPFPSQDEHTGTTLPVYTGGAGNLGAGNLGAGNLGAGNLGASPGTGETKQKFVSYDTALGFNPGMTNCPTCQQQVMTHVDYKAGRYAWLMCLLFICLGLVLCCCLIPLLMKKFKDAHHTCPRCNRVLHIEKRQCCK